MTGRPTGRVRRRSRHLPSLVRDLEPDVEWVLYRDEPEPEPAGDDEALYGPQSDETDPSAIPTPENDQGEHEAPDWSAQRAEAHALMAEMDAVLAAYDREVSRRELRARLSETEN